MCALLVQQCLFAGLEGKFKFEGEYRNKIMDET